MKKNTENTTVATENDKAEEIVSYEVMAMNGKNKELTFYNTDLIRHTQSIQKYRDAGNLAILAIAHEFDSMDKDESYKTAGFKTVADYGRVVFDYKPATVSLYLRSARAFLTENEKGEVNYKPNLPKLTVGQMIELLPLVKDGEDVSELRKSLKSQNLQRLKSWAIMTRINCLRIPHLKPMLKLTLTPLWLRLRTTQRLWLTLNTMKQWTQRLRKLWLSYRNSVLNLPSSIKQSVNTSRLLVD